MSGLFLAATRGEKLAKQGDSESEGNPEDIFHERRALFDAIMNGVGFILFCREDSGDVFEEINATFFAGPAVALFVMARRTLEPQRIVAALAKTRDIAHIRPTFRALNHGASARYVQIGRGVFRLAWRRVRHRQILPGSEGLGRGGAQRVRSRNQYWPMGQQSEGEDPTRLPERAETEPARRG